MRKSVTAAVAVFAAVATLAGGCAAKGDDEATEGESTESTTEEGATSGAAQEGEGGASDFGDLTEVCGPGDLTVAEDEAAGSTSSLKLGMANDRTSQIRPGLNKEMWDASNAFVAWCNEQGGIGGLPIELVDIDGKLLEVETAMATACSGVFMLVGGGQVQDNLQFSDKPESDFHQCGLADIPGFTVSPEKSESNGQIQPVPHPSATYTSGWLRDFQQLYPEESESMVEMWGELPSMETIKNQTLAAMEAEGVENAGVFTYPVTGQSDWTPSAQQVIGTGAQSLHFVGEPTNLGALVKALREQGWEGYPMLETNHYDKVYVDSAGAANAEGSVIRSAFHPFEEADRWPAVQQYIDVVEENVDDPKIAVLGMQSFSAWLLFATAAKACGEDNDGELTRACVLEAADAVDDWTGGGLHVPTDPGPEGGPPAACGMLVTVNADGEFERLFPEIGSEDDDLDGFKCHEDALLEVPENAGLGVVSPDQPI
jgi:ABC-type branched-subunit amino acid transport system substrate-binding protein